ncbi:MAG: patatin-like phospholipase family protein [Limnochordaceae bacterium]|nr:patatin-like phospholipase family protein [Limnochordaceae bacterium]
MSTGDAARVALVLSGGGARGAYQVGALRAVAERFGPQGIGIVSGSSIGAVNGAVMAEGIEAGNLEGALAALEQEWLSLSGLLRFNWRALLAGLVAARGTRSVAPRAAGHRFPARRRGGGAAAVSLPTAPAAHGRLSPRRSGGDGDRPQRRGDPRVRPYAAGRAGTGCGAGLVGVPGGLRLPARSGCAGTWTGASSTTRRSTRRFAGEPPTSCSSAPPRGAARERRGTKAGRSPTSMR